MAICDLQLGGWSQVTAGKITRGLWFFPQNFTITLPETNIFAPEQWLVFEDDPASFWGFRPILRERKCSF